MGLFKIKKDLLLEYFMKNNKKILSLIMSIILALSLSISMLAVEKDQNMSVGRTFTWSPYTSSNAISGKTESAGQVTSEYISVWTDFYWDNMGVTAVNADGYYPTIEQNALDGTNLSAEYQYCDAANVHFDTDDDNLDWDKEESEVILLSGAEKNTEYTFNTRFERSNGAANSGLINIIAQRSELWITEYNTVDYDLVEQADWLWSYGRSLVSSDSSEAETSATSAMEESKLLFHDAGETEDELRNYFSNQLNEFTSVMMSQPATVGEQGNMTTETTKVTVTFTAPISMEEMLIILENAGATLYRYKAKFINAEGKWCNVSSSNVDEMMLIENANAMANEVGKPHISYEGIISMEVYIPVTIEAITQLNEADFVFCVDTSEYIWKHSSNYISNTRLLVPDYAWEVANF